MASSRKSKRAEPAGLDLRAHVAAQLKGVVKPGDRLRVALSGGVDSVVLLDILSRLAPRLRVSLHALHVNHQLSPNAAAWARFCRALCRTLDVPCTVVRVDVARGNSTERAAREARYAALMRAGADHIALAHNADDQAETVLLQLLRGAGVRGLAAMRPVGLADVPSPRAGCSILRPLLDVSRSHILAYAARRKLEWVDDESNASAEYLRNWLRHEIVPRLAERVPGYRKTLTRAAHNLSEAAELLDDMARLDGGDEPLSVSALKKLSAARAKNLLRYAIRRHGWRAPDADRLTEALRQALSARVDARVAVDLGECTLHRGKNELHLVGADPANGRSDDRTWRGEPTLVLDGMRGVLAMRRERGTGISVARLTSGPVSVRSRRGGETLKPAPNRPTRTVKNLLQEAGIPAWDRDRLPFIYSGGTLVCIPGVAVDHRYLACPGEDSVVPVWRPSVPLVHRRRA